MPSPTFKKPGFRERTASAAKAKRKALEKFRAAKPLQEGVIEERLAARVEREAAEAKKSAERRAALELERSERKARAEKRRELELDRPVLTELERKAARDSRYTSRRR